MGDPMDPIIANNVRSEIIVAVDTFQRNQIFMVNQTETPFIENMEFYDWDDKKFPLLLPTQEELYNPQVRFQGKTNGLQFNPETEVVEKFSVWDEVSDTIYDLSYYQRYNTQGLSTFMFTAEESDETGAPYCKEVIDMSKKFQFNAIVILDPTFKQ